MDRSQKEALVASMHSVFEDAAMVVVTHYSGLTVADMTNLRFRMLEAGASFKVTKNRLTRLALAGTKFEGIADLFTGPTAIAYSADPVAPAKVVTDFAKGNDKLMIVGGALGEKQLDEAGVRALASLPSLDESRAKLVGLLQTPASRLVGVLGAPGGQVARVINAYSQKDAAA